MHAFIRMMIAERDREFSEQIRILYGGSMGPKNAESLLVMPDIDGGLLGRAALVAEDFMEICKTASRCYQQKQALLESRRSVPANVA
jgi:triosephosphate isomerase